MIITREKVAELLAKDDYTIKDISDCTNEERLVTCWGTNGVAILQCIDVLASKNQLTEDTYDNFLNDCIACGGNWGGMLLTGIQKRFPLIYDLIPERLGATGNESFFTLCCLLQLLNIRTD